MHPPKIPPHLSLFLLCATVTGHPIPSNDLGLELSVLLDSAGSVGSHLGPATFPTTIAPLIPPSHYQISNPGHHTSHEHSKRNDPEPTSDKVIIRKIANLQAAVDKARKEATSGTASVTELEDMAFKLEMSRDRIVEPLSPTIIDLYSKQLKRQKAKAVSQAHQHLGPESATGPLTGTIPDSEASNSHTEPELETSEGPSELERLTGHAAAAHSAYTDGLMALTKAAKERLPPGETLPMRFLPEVFSL